MRRLDDAMYYNYREGKRRVEEILTSSMEVVEAHRVPSDDKFTFENAYHAWVMAIFVDIRDSTKLMDNPDQEYVAKVVRSFTSEIIEILRDDDRLREIGIRGDCVYAVYTTPLKTDVYHVFDGAIYVNTYLNMLNAILREHGYPAIRAGIGVAIGHDHVIKAGRKGVGINAAVWMGKAVSEASKLSGYGEKTVSDRIVLSGLTFDNIIEEFEEKMPEKDPRSWFHRPTGYATLPFNAYYCNVVMSDMNDWVKNGVPE